MEKKKKKTQTDHFLNNETGEIKNYLAGDTTCLAFVIN